MIKGPEKAVAGARRDQVQRVSLRHLFDIIERLGELDPGIDEHDVRFESRFHDQQECGERILAPAVGYRHGKPGLPDRLPDELPGGLYLSVEHPGIGLDGSLPTLFHVDDILRCVFFL